MTIWLNGHASRLDPGVSLAEAIAALLTGAAPPPELALADPRRFA